MIELGRLNTMQILRDTSVGMFLGGKGMEDTLLPNRYVPIDKRVGDEMEVFVYLDGEERAVATTDRPFVMRDEFAALEVVAVNRIGAFLDWGLEKDLLLPFKEQTKRLNPGDKVFVKVLLDDKTNRLLATMKWKKAMGEEKPHFYNGEKVSAVIADKTDLGYSAIVNNKFLGLIYRNEVFKPLNIGDSLEAHIKKVREDGKLDLQLQGMGMSGIEPNAHKILELLGQNDGKLALHDKSNPEDVKRIAQMSKKSFKKAIGSLYKQRLIVIGSDGIKLAE